MVFNLVYGHRDNGESGVMECTQGVLDGILSKVLQNANGIKVTPDYTVFPTFQRLAMLPNLCFPIPSRISVSFALDLDLQIQVHLFCSFSPFLPS